MRKNTGVHGNGEKGYYTYEAEKIALAALAIIFIGVITLFCYWVVLSEETNIVASALHPVSDGGTPCVITQEDFYEHPALEDMIVHRKCVLVSHGVFLDFLVRITPGSDSFSAVHDPDSRYSKRYISWDEREALNQYSGCAYNGTVYDIVQSA